jgi:hypothetical protein
MQQYVIKDYQKGYEEDQARIGQEVANHWIWPYAYDLEDLLEIHARPDFDPETRHYCFLGDEMVGTMFSVITPSKDGDGSIATLDFPRFLPEHEQAAELLIEKALDTLKKKGVSRVEGRVTTMCPGDVQLAEKMGFSIWDWGYKVYYSYEMAWGKLNLPCDAAKEVIPEEDLDECAKIASLWYKRPPDWCHSLLAEWHREGVITHLGLWQQGELIASCMAAPNLIRPNTAAIYYIHTPDDHSLKALLVAVISKCVDFGVGNLIADLVNEHLPYEPVYQELGFRKVAEWARCAKLIQA